MQLRKPQKPLWKPQQHQKPLQMQWKAASPAAKAAASPAAEAAASPATEVAAASTTASTTVWTASARRSVRSVPMASVLKSLKAARRMPLRKPQKPPQPFRKPLQPLRKPPQPLRKPQQHQKPLQMQWKAASPAAEEAASPAAEAAASLAAEAAASTTASTTVWTASAPRFVRSVPMASVLKSHTAARRMQLRKPQKPQQQEPLQLQ